MRRRTPPGLDPEAQALWDEVARTVKPLKNRPIPPVGVQPSPPRAALRSPSNAVLAPPLSSAQKSPAPLAERGGEKRVRRGKVEPVARLDLHGHTQESGRRAVHAFILRVFADGGGVAIIVTGKGARLVSGETAPGILKQRLPEWLAASDLRPYLAGFAPAHTRHGGGGAFYVWIKARP